MPLNRCSINLLALRSRMGLYGEVPCKNLSGPVRPANPRLPRCLLGGLCKTNSMKYPMKPNLKNTLSRQLALISVGFALFQTCYGDEPNIVQNGSFEGGFPGWSGDLGVDMAVPFAADGSSLARVNSFIYQDLITMPGQTYHLRFAMAGNPNWPDLITLNTSWNGSLVATTTWNPVGHSYQTSLGWIFSDINVQASASVTRLMFQSPTPPSQTPFLDAVSVTALPVPEPSCFALFGLAIVLAGGIRKKILRPTTPARITARPAAQQQSWPYDHP